MYYFCTLMWCPDLNFIIESDPVSATTNRGDRKPNHYDCQNFQQVFTGVSVHITFSTALINLQKFLLKRSFFDQNQQLLNNVEPFERILRAFFMAQCPYKLSSFLAQNGSSRFRLFACDFRRFRFFFFGICMLFESGPPENLQS